MPRMGLASLLCVGCAATVAPVPAGPAPVKVYLMAGQSNIEGPGKSKYLEANAPELSRPREDVRCVFAGRRPGLLGPGYGFRSDNFGPELSFGHAMGDAIADPIVIFKSAAGGTTLHRNWRPPSAVKRAGGEVGPLYRTMIRRAHNLLAHLGEVFPEYKGRRYEVAGFVWFQGENDSCGKGKDGVGFWSYYKENLLDLLKDVRHDLGVPGLPVVIAQINDSGCWDSSGGGPVVRAAQRYAADNAENVSMIVTLDLDPGYHYDSASHVVIGERLAEAMLPYSEKAVHEGDASIKKARERFLARELKGGSPDVSTLRKGLIAYWKFDEGEGVETTGSSPNRYKGVLRGGAQWVRGLFGRALKLTGDQSIEIPGFVEPVGPSGNIEGISISFWIRTPLMAGVNRIGKGIGREIKRDNSNWFISDRANVAGWDVCNFDEGFPHFTAAIDGEGARCARSHWGDPRIHGDGYEWRHVVSIYDGGSRKMLMYVDSRAVSRPSQKIKGNHILPARTTLAIGGGLTGEGNFQIFDEVAIWSRALTTEEVAALYNNSRSVEIPTQ